MLCVIEQILGSEGHAVRVATSGADGARKALDSSVDLIVLDLGLPDMDGLELTRRLRDQIDTPILILTGRADISSRVEGLDAGADDYLPKPFDPNELCARVRSVLRRAERGRSVMSDATECRNRPPWKLLPADNVLSAENGQRVTLTEREYHILSILMRRANSIVSRDELQSQVTGRQWHSEDRSLDVHISHLRKKFREIGGEPCPIKTCRGRGFMFEGHAG